MLVLSLLPNLASGWGVAVHRTTLFKKLCWHPRPFRCRCKTFWVQEPCDGGVQRYFLFDAHNHVTLSIPGGIASLGTYHDVLNPASPCQSAIVQHSTTVAEHFLSHGGVGGLAIMSTQPRDFLLVDSMYSAISSQGMSVKRSYGVHPWFLSSTQKDGEQTSIGVHGLRQERFWWLDTLRLALQSAPDAAVGEIGLDGHRYDPETKELVAPMSLQEEVFEVQLRLAAEMQRPAVVHAVRAWGSLFKILSRVGRRSLPPKIYFHAFGGKPAVVDQLNALCQGCDVYYGFAPVINFRASKTAEVMRKVGVDRLVLETDLEDYTQVLSDLQENAEFVSDVFGLSVEKVLEKTWSNTLELYSVSKRLGMNAGGVSDSGE